MTMFTALVSVLPTASRPTAYVQSHSWLGWGVHDPAQEEE